MLDFIVRSGEEAHKLDHSKLPDVSLADLSGKLDHQPCVIALSYFCNIILL